MLALTVHKRTVTNEEGAPVSEDIAFSMYVFGCFAGFNHNDAFEFVKERADTLVNIRFNKQGRLQSHTTKRFDLAAAEREELNTATDWELLGIGWAADNIAAKNPISGRIPSSTAIAILNSGTAAQHSHEHERVIRGWSASSMMTPNEREIRRALDLIHTRGAVVPANPRDPMGCIEWAAMKPRWYFPIQFVGSERPSGQAIAFLQTYRNAMYWLTQPETYAISTRIIKDLDAATGGKHVLPILDHIMRMGSDACIVEQAGSGYLAECLRSHFWDTKGLYQNPIPMSEEGRYVKGDQAFFLSHNSRPMGADVARQMQIVMSCIDKYANLLTDVHGAYGYLSGLLAWGDMEEESLAQLRKFISTVNNPAGKVEMSNTRLALTNACTRIARIAAAEQPF